MLRRIRWAVQIVLLLIVAAILYIYLPQNDIVRVTGTQVVRETRDANTTPPQVIDVRQIQTRTPDNQSIVYRNEDTGMGFPFYFKYSTDTLQADAQALISDEASPRWVVVTHYGLRSELMSMFPNAISIREAEGPDETIIPWFNIIFILVLIGLVLFIRRWFVRRFTRAA
ncbi:MAG: DUF1523 family protein [Pseudomonadota bacterium]